jgi:hypothetical protein
LYSWQFGSHVPAWQDYEVRRGRHAIANDRGDRLYAI